MYYYAVLNHKDVVTSVSSNDEPIIDDTMIPITEEQYNSQSVVGMYYNRVTEEYQTATMSQLTEHSSDEIQYSTEEKNMTTKIQEIVQSIEDIELTPGPQGPTGATGADGEDGITPHIGTNGNWFIGTTDTGVAAQGPAGATGPQGPQGDNASLAAVTAHMGNQTYNIPSGADYTNIPLTTSVITGSGLTVVDNQVRIGSGISKVMISAQLCVGSGNIAGNKYLAIRKNVTTQLARSQRKLCDYTIPQTMAIPPLMVSVEEGDLLTLDYYGSQGDTVYGDCVLTYLTVEKMA